MRFAAMGFLQCVMESLPGIFGGVGKYNGSFSRGRGLAGSSHKVTAFVVKLEGVPGSGLVLTGHTHNAFINDNGCCCRAGGGVLVVHGYIHVIAARGSIVRCGSILVALHILDFQCAVHVCVTDDHVKVADDLIVSNTANGTVYLGYTEGIFAGGRIWNTPHQVRKVEFVKVGFGFPGDLFGFGIRNFYQLVENGGFPQLVPYIVFAFQPVLQLEGKGISFLPVTAFQQFCAADNQIDRSNWTGGIVIGIGNVVFTGLNRDRLLGTAGGSKAGRRGFCYCDGCSLQKVFDTHSTIGGGSHSNVAAFVCGDLPLRSFHGFARVLTSKRNRKGKIDTVGNQISCPKGVGNLLADDQITTWIKTGEERIDKWRRFYDDVRKGTTQHRRQQQRERNQQRQCLMEFERFSVPHKSLPPFLQIPAIKRHNPKAGYAL